jgi:hypothetical protein
MGSVLLNGMGVINEYSLLPDQMKRYDVSNVKFDV